MPEFDLIYLSTCDGLDIYLAFIEFQIKKRNCRRYYNLILIYIYIYPLSFYFLLSNVKYVYNKLNKKSLSIWKLKFVELQIASVKKKSNENISNIGALYNLLFF